MAKQGPFDFVKAINQKTPIPETMDGYSRYIINHALSGFEDTIEFVLLLSEYDHVLTDEQHFEFLMGIVRPRKRFTPWLKADSPDDLKLIKEAYGYSTTKAREALRIMTKDDLTQLRKMCDKGGRE